MNSVEIFRIAAKCKDHNYDMFGKVMQHILIEAMQGEFVYNLIDDCSITDKIINQLKDYGFDVMYHEATDSCYCIGFWKISWKLGDNYL